MKLKPSTFLLIASILGAVAVAFGALGAHALEKVLDADQLDNWATAVRYQMWHALLLVALSMGPTFQNPTRTKDRDDFPCRNPLFLRIHLSTYRWMEFYVAHYTSWRTLVSNRLGAFSRMVMEK